MKNTDETRNYFVQEINQNEAIYQKHKKVCITLNYIGHFILASEVTGCVWISDFASLVGIPIGIKSSSIVKNLWNNCSN